MIGCICCHGPTYDDGLCPMCDWKEIEKKHKKGGDASCPESVRSAGTTTHSANAPVSNAAPTSNPKGCGTVAWLIEELKKWPADTKVFVDWDYEGDNENEVDTVEPYTRYGQKGIKIL